MDAGQREPQRLVLRGRFRGVAVGIRVGFELLGRPDDYGARQIETEFSEKEELTCGMHVGALCHQITKPSLGEQVAEPGRDALCRSNLIEQDVFERLT